MDFDLRPVDPRRPSSLSVSASAIPRWRLASRSVSVRLLDKSVIFAFARRPVFGRAELVAQFRFGGH